MYDDDDDDVHRAAAGSDDAGGVATVCGRGCWLTPLGDS